MTEYKEIPVTDWRSLKVGDVISYDAPDRHIDRVYIAEKLADGTFRFERQYLGSWFPNVQYMKNIRKLVKIESNKPMTEYQEIPVTDWRQLKAGDSIKWTDPNADTHTSIVERREPDTYVGYVGIKLTPAVSMWTTSSGWISWNNMQDVCKLVKIEHPKSQNMNTTPTYSQELLQAIKSKNAWVIAAVTQNGQLDFTVSQSMEQSEAAAKGKIEQLSKKNPGVIFTTFKLQHAVRQQPAQIVVK